jgi:nucleotide-binding universal stress UspA family protein
MSDEKEWAVFNSVVIGVDGREGGRDAVALGRRLSDVAGSVTLAHVYRAEARPWRSSGATFETVRRDDSRTLLERAREESGLAAELRSVGAPSVGRGLHTLVEEIGADLLVVGSTRSSHVGRVHLGDDTAAALSGAPCAVAVAPAGYASEAGEMREIGVGFDGSDESRHALAVARLLGARLNVRVSAFEAVSLPGRAFAHGAPPVAETAIDELVERAHARVSTLEGIDPHATFGHPPDELAAYSASLDLLVLGSRDYGPIGRLVHGSTARQLARTSRCPLLVLTRAARERDADLPGLDQPVLEGVADEIGPSPQP